MMQKPRDRRLSDRDLFLRQSVFEFGQRDVRLLRHPLPHHILVRRQRKILVAAEFGRVDAARLPVKLEEADDRTEADPALLRSYRDRGAALDRPDHSPAQIRRIWLRHACRPPPSRQLESYSRRYGNPRFSLFGKRSSALVSRAHRYLESFTPGSEPGGCRMSMVSWLRPAWIQAFFAAAINTSSGGGMSSRIRRGSRSLAAR